MKAIKYQIIKSCIFAYLLLTFKMNKKTANQAFEFAEKATRAYMMWKFPESMK